MRSRPMFKTFQSFVELLLAGFFIWYFWTHDLIYTTILMLMSFTLGIMHNVIMRFYLNKGATPQ